MWDNPAMTHMPRILLAVLAASCIALDATAILYFQEYLGLDPCPMCIVSRMIFMALAAVGIVGAIHGPRPGGTAIKAYGAAVMLLAVGGIALSIRHSWVQHHPPKVESCGADLDFMLNTLPLAQALPKIFSGSGSCSKVDWSLAGLSIPEWALVWYAGFFAVALWMGFLRKK